MSTTIREFIGQVLQKHSGDFKPLTPRQTIGDSFQPNHGDFKELKFLQESSKTDQFLETSKPY